MAAKTNIPKVMKHKANFDEALHAIAARVGATVVADEGTNISAFKINYSAVLDRAKSGSLEVLTKGRHRFVILTEEQVLALVSNRESELTIGELFADLPSMMVEGARPRAVSVGTADHYRLPR